MKSRRKTFERVRLATVAFGVRMHETFRILGSGVIVDTRGVVVTARHVVDDVEKAAKELKPTVPNAAPQLLIPGEVKYTRTGPDSHSIEFSMHAVSPTRFYRSDTVDLAVLWFRECPIQPTAIPIDYKADLREGDPVATCGFPYGLEVHEGTSVVSSFLTGIVSAIAPHPVFPPEARIRFLLQLPVNPGNSGGPVFDPDTGRVLGIVSSILVVNSIPTGLCICEPAQRLHHIIEKREETAV